MSTNLDMKNGEFFEAATEALYQLKIEELQAKLATAVEALERLERGTRIGVDIPCELDPLDVNAIATEALARIRKGE